MASALRSQFLRQMPAASRFAGCAARPGPITSTFLKSRFVKDDLPGSSRVAAFHTTARRDILPPLPQRLQGTANEAALVPPPHAMEGGYHWAAERAISVLLIPLTVAPFVGGSLNPVMDMTFCLLLVGHSHIGFSSCITDYFPKKRTPKTRTALEYILLASSAAVAWGLWEFETNDVGVTEAVKRVWKA